MIKVNLLIFFMHLLTIFTRYIIEVKYKKYILHSGGTRVLFYYYSGLLEIFSHT